MSGPATAEVNLPAEPTAVGRARRAVRVALEESGGAHLRSTAELLVSELVTNSLVHAGTDVTVRITADALWVRVEVGDGSPHLPVRRSWSEAAGTGRGMLIVDEHADRWSAARTGKGKVVWFEIGRPSSSFTLDVPESDTEADDVVEVVLLQVPLLMHWAWQEHATALLREFLLHTLETASALRHHAAASAALSLLNDQLPRPDLPAEPSELMVSSVEPMVTAEMVTLRVPTTAVPDFEILDDLLVHAVGAAKDGRLLGAPTQPEVSEFREWLCGEVAAQAHHAPPTPWHPPADVRLPSAELTAPASVRHEVAESDTPLMATSGASVILAVSPSAVELLGYRHESELVGRRVLVVMPARFHQAHIAGTTLHATNGRDVLLSTWLTVPMVRADGSEVLVRLHVRRPRLDHDGHVFLAHLQLPDAPAPT